MIIETLEWYTPEEKLPDDKRDVLVYINANNFTWIDKAYYCETAWVIPPYNTTYLVPLYWCEIPKGPSDGTLNATAN